MNIQQQKDFRDTVKGMGIFILVACFLSSLIYIYVINPRINVRVENFIEIFQETFLLITTALFWILVRRLPEEKGGLMLIAGFFTALLIREMDCAMDIISRSAWVYVEVVVLFPILFCVCRSGLTSILSGLARFVRSDSFVLMAVGVAMLLFYSRMIGAEWLLQLYMPKQYGLRIAKRFSEEASELVSYSIILIAAARYFYVRRVSLRTV